ncbi:MAG: PLP-dependent lyase/thiolase [Candidatus Magasanikbacteria bacterium]|nr:PLP-dependent lyase/thiolase [Candidatus Magasanikbacteria bacterium]
MKTPQLSFPKLAEALSITNEIWLKREDLHHYGSHKGRSIPLIISEYRKRGIKNFVISSSGNAALAAILAIQKFNQNNKGEPLKLVVLVGKKIDKEKLSGLKKAIADTIHDTWITIQENERPKQTAFQMEKDGKGTWLRQSTDDLALTGYQELAAELAKIPNLSAVFVPTSSGTTAQGLCEGFAALDLNPQIHIVQTEECHPMVITSANHPMSPSFVRRGDAVSPPARPFGRELKAERGGVALEGRGGGSLASAIVDKVAHRKTKILEILKNSRGAGWIATNEEIISTIKLVKEKTGIEISPNSALSIVGLKQAIAAGEKWEGAVVCLVTGK